MQAAVFSGGSGKSEEYGAWSPEDKYFHTNSWVVSGVFLMFFGGRGDRDSDRTLSNT